MGTTATPLDRHTLAGTPALRVAGATKRYGGVTVLHDVALEIAPGEVRALLGENGAGKSTLIKILAGVVPPDGGTIEVDGSPVQITSARSAVAQGITTLHQELQIVPGLSIAENVLLGHPLPRRLGAAVDWSSLERRASDLLRSLDQDLDVRRDAETLAPVGQTMTAIARALSHDARVVILDEPTAALTDTETAQLFAAVRRLTERGVAVLYVSHRLEEVMALCDTFTVLRNGEKVTEGRIDETDVASLITAMAGRPFDAIFPPRATRAQGATTVLEVSSLGGRRLRDLSFALHAGEILGVAGLAGSGRSELLRILGGAQHPEHGRITVGGMPYEPRSVGAALQRGVALLPPERKSQGLAPDTIERNTNATTFPEHARARVLMSRVRAERHAHGLAERLRLRRRGLSQDVFTLSGGNQQKVVLSKVLAVDPRVLLLDEPTRGVDVGTKSEIYHLVRDQVDAGGAAIVVSSELPELLGWCDRVLVLHEGRLIGVTDAATTDEATILSWCYGRKP